MSQENKKVKLVGYWNGDSKNPEITFDVREDDNRHLVRIELDIVPRQPTSEYDINRVTSDLKKLHKGLRNLVTSTRRLK